MNKRTRQPTHPGKIIREDYLIPLSITISQLALYLDVSKKSLEKITNEKGAITPDMALRLSRAFETTPDLWLNLQKKYDLWKAEHNSTSWQSIKPLSSQPIHAA